MRKLDAEEWRSVPNWEGVYEVSSFGRVRSLDRIDRLGRGWSGRILKTTVDRSTGYQKVNLSCRGTQRHAYVHHLVAEAFLGTRPLRHEINHLDGVKTNNGVWNLEYVEKAENVRHAYRTGLNHGLSRFGSTNPNAKLNESLAQLTLATQGQVSGVELARAMGVSTSTISRIRKGQSWRHLQTSKSQTAA